MEDYTVATMMMQTRIASAEKLLRAKLNQSTMRGTLCLSSFGVVAKATMATIRPTTGRAVVNMPSTHQTRLDAEGEEEVETCKSAFLSWQGVSIWEGRRKSNPRTFAVRGLLKCLLGLVLRVLLGRSVLVCSPFAVQAGEDKQDDDAHQGNEPQEHHPAGAAGVVQAAHADSQTSKKERAVKGGNQDVEYRALQISPRKGNSQNENGDANDEGAE